MRSFIAIEIDEATRQRLAEVSSKGWIAGKAVRWVRPESMHLTLKFLGEIAPSLIPDVTRAIEDASREIRPFYIEIGGVGFFPDAGRPRVFWVRIHDREGLLARFHGRLQETISSLGFEMETRAFHPHLTLARIKGRVDLGAGIGAMEDDVFGSQTVQEIVLFKSVLRPQGPRYTPLSVVTLKE